MDELKPLPCFVCGGEVRVDHESLIDAMGFISHGGWGSLYDPSGTRNFLRINIHDACVEAAARQGRVLEGARVPKPDEITYVKWDG